MLAKLSPEQLDELRAIDSPTIANAIEYFTVRPRVAGYCGANVRCLTPDAGFMLGYAVTCKGDSTTEDKERREHTELYRAITALGGFHYYGRGLVVAHGRPSIYDVGATLNIDGMEVHPGDLLHGDENGVTVIPAEIADKIAAKALEHREMEQQRLKEILSPEFLDKQFERATQYR